MELKSKCWMRIRKYVSMIVLCINNIYYCFFCFGNYCSHIFSVRANSTHRKHWTNSRRWQKHVHVASSPNLLLRRRSHKQRRKLPKIQKSLPQRPDPHHAKRQQQKKPEVSMGGKRWNVCLGIRDVCHDIILFYNSTIMDIYIIFYLYMNMFILQKIPHVEFYNAKIRIMFIRTNE